MVFLELAWFAIYLVDYSRPTRSRRRRLKQNTFINPPAFAVHWLDPIHSRDIKDP